MCFSVVVLIQTLENCHQMYPERRNQCPASSESHGSPLLRRSLVDLVPQWPSILCGKINTMTDFLKEGPREQAPRGARGHAPQSSLFGFVIH